MCRILLAFALSIVCASSNAQERKISPLLKSWPISVTPLSLWNNDVSVSAGAEYRFHSSFSTRTALDYIYGSYFNGDARTSGVRIRQELRYYVAGNHLMTSRSRVWPYFAVVAGAKRVKTGFADWIWQQTGGESFAMWQKYHAINQEWFLMGKTGMQTAFGRQKRFLFDFSLGFGNSYNNVTFHNRQLQDTGIPFNSNSRMGINSENTRSGKFLAFNMEACFGYRLLK